MRLKPHSSRLLLLPLLCFTSMCITGCASINESITGWLSSNVEAFGVIDGQVISGKARFTQEREATLQLHSADGTELSCLGILHYTATSSGMIDFVCNDRRTAQLPFQAFSLLSGVGRTTAGPVELSLTYGLTAEKAATFLAVPLELLLKPKANPKKTADPMNPFNTSMLDSATLPPTPDHAEGAQSNQNPLPRTASAAIGI